MQGRCLPKDAKPPTQHHSFFFRPTPFADSLRSEGLRWVTGVKDSGRTTTTLRDDQSGSIDVSFVMPCLNEAQTIEWCVRRAAEACEALWATRGLRGEIVVADNGSSDGSQSIARHAGACVVSVAERGYGAALRAGFESAQGRYIVMGDSDRSYDFLEAVPMIDALVAGADLCMGSRFAGDIKPGAMPWKNRYIGNPVLSAVLRVFFRTPISDAHCGIRALTKDAFDRLNLSSNGMEFASEMVLKSALMRLRITEVPVTLWPDGRGRPPHLRPWRDGLRHLAYMFLLSPAWLFFVPATLMLALGIGIFAKLLATPEGSTSSLMGLPFGDHWAIASSALVIMAVQTAILGTFALLHGYAEGYRVPGPVAQRFLTHSRLQGWVLAGFALALTGAFWAGAIVLSWVSSDFGTLQAVRGLSASSTMIVAGAQVFFAGFFVSILAGNRSRHAKLLS